MRNNLKNQGYFFIIAVSATLFLFLTPIYANYSVTTWGDNHYGACNLPSPNENFKSISAGINHTLGLKNDGSIVAWGRNTDNECNIPSPNTGFKAISAGGYHSLALKIDGSIVAWGRNVDNECNVPSPNTNFIAIAAGYYHSLGLKADGKIIAWGSNARNQCNVPEPNELFEAIAAGEYHSLGLKSNSSVVAWGNNAYGQTSIPFPNMGYKAIAAGQSHTLALKQDGSIVGWGRSDSNQRTVPLPNADFKAIAAGGVHSLGLKIDGSIVAFGDNYYGQINVPSSNSGFEAIAAGQYHSLAIRGNTSFITAKSCTIKAKNDANDYFAFNGTMTATEVQINSASQWKIEILSADESIYQETIASNLFIHDNNSYFHKHTSSMSDSNAISKLSYNSLNGKLTIMAPKIDLTGLTCPVYLNITIGSYKGRAEIGEDIVNKKKLIPIQLVRNIEDNFRADKIKVKAGRKSSTDSMIAKGKITLKNEPNSMKNLKVEVKLNNQPFAIKTGSFVPKGKSGFAFACNKIPLKAGGYINASFDFEKCTFTVEVKKSLIYYQTGEAILSLTMGDFSEGTMVNLGTPKN